MNNGPPLFSETKTLVLYLLLTPVCLMPHLAGSSLTLHHGQASAAAALCPCVRLHCSPPPACLPSDINGLLSLGADALSANVCFMHANEKTGKNRFMFGSAQR